MSIKLVFAAFAASALMLTVIQVPFNLAFLAWAAMVPFILVCSPQIKVKRLVVISYLVSLGYWLGNIYWVGYVTRIGWVAFCLYTAILWPILAICLRWCRVKKIPLFIAAPILIVGVERLGGLFLGGFFWRFLGHSQYANITVIQIADIFGVAGVSFLIAMVNGLAAELIISGSEKRFFKVGNFLKAAVVCVAVVGAILYGRWRINESGKFIEVGPLVASVQSNVPQSVKASGQVSEEIVDELLKMSDESIGSTAELVVWPETMVRATLDRRVLERLAATYHCHSVDRMLREHSKGKANVLVGAYGGTLEYGDDLQLELGARYNSAFLYQKDGERAKEQYHKIHLVPFGEVVPFKKSSKMLHNLLMKFTPYDYDYSLDAGTEYTVFKMRGEKQREYKFAVMICYEDTIALIARRFSIDENGEKNIDWLVNISNDGWFVRFDEGQVLASTELPQHAAICVFRAVENRVAIVRSVNTGVSCLIDSLGRIRDGFVAGNLPHKAMARAGAAGWFADRVPVDKRVTFFSKCGQWLDFCCAVCVFLVIIVPHVTKFIRSKGIGKIQ